MTHYASTKFAVRSCPLLMIVCLVCGQWSSAQETQSDGTGNSSRYQPGVRNSRERPLNAKQLYSLVETLRQKSGFRGLEFDAYGFLRLGDRSHIDGGSSAARDLLIAAVDRGRAIDLESHHRTSEVAFARLASSVSYISKATGNRIEVYPIQIDFSDFAHLRGDREAIEAFDLGFVVLHELAHAALGLRDAMVEGQEPGECEEYINRIRRELGVAERQSYSAQTRLERPFLSQKPVHQAELLFAKQTLAPKARPQMLSLSWEAERVGIVRPVNDKPQTIPRRSQASIAP
ncbi:MAG: hypothetical protein ACKVZH_12045 [Blastocatellia bacterium]